MEIKVKLRDRNKALRDLERAEKRIQEAAQILKYDMAGAFTLEIEEQPSAVTDDCSGTNDKSIQ